MNFEAGHYPDVHDEAKSRPRRRWLVLAGVVVALILVIGFIMMRHKSDASATGDPSKSAQAPVVTVVPASNGAVAGQLTATGTLAAKRMIPVGIVGEGGEVRTVNVDAGSWVERGAVLASVDRSVQVQALAGQQAQVGVMRANLNIAQSNLDRAQALVGRGFISKADVDAKIATRDAAAAQLRQAEAAVAQTRASNARLDIRAPVAGLILERDVQPGQVVGAASSPLFKMAEGGVMELDARLDESDLAQMHIGAPATVTPVGSDQSFTGHVWQIAPMIDAQTRQGIARIQLPYSHALRPGGFATALLSTGTVHAAVLPESAIQSDDRGTYVYIVDAANKVERRAVTPGEVTAKGVVVSGLNGTERVVLYAGGFLNAGQTVRPRLATTN